MATPTSDRPTASSDTTGKIVDLQGRRNQRKWDKLIAAGLVRFETDIPPKPPTAPHLRDRRS